MAPNGVINNNTSNTQNLRKNQNVVESAFAPVVQTLNVKNNLLTVGPIGPFRPGTPCSPFGPGNP